ncbi:MAG: carbohydrate ABC transporter permease [Saccharofermentans sp.]|nr:carbohydrate ABC transporter permease [Saccharofermentans sp.]
MAQSTLSKKQNNRVLQVFVYIVSILMLILSVLPFWIMFVNATRSSEQIQQHAISLIPGVNLQMNWMVLQGKDFSVITGFKNSLIISGFATLFSVYFSCLTAYAISAYEWKLKRPFFSFIMAVMMIPGTVTMIGFYQMVYKIGMTNNLLMLILPAIANPMMVFFMRQYMEASLSMEIVESARIDGAREFYTFNKIIIPIMKPAIATQAIFTFVANWNNLFIPLVLLTDKENYTMPLMVSLLNGDIYRVEHGAVYLALSLTVIPLVIVYLILSKYIVEGVAMGSVKG